MVLASSFGFVLVVNSLKEQSVEQSQSVASPFIQSDDTLEHPLSLSFEQLGGL
jgi:hypothetical protein